MVATPEINSFNLVDTTHDFIIIGSDGIFDRLSTEEAVSCVWEAIKPKNTT